MSSVAFIIGALPDPREAARFRHRMKQMTPSEIIATLDEIASLGLSSSDNDHFPDKVNETK